MFRHLVLGVGGFVLVTAGIGAPMPQTPPKTDNTAVNKNPGPTADQQKETAADRTLSQEIRKSVVADKSLSTYAHNVKIISTNGTVTLRGPVRSAAEKAAIEAKAKEIAGVAAVDNELTIEPEKK
jgi:hyperosmotically inducible protein